MYWTPLLFLVFPIKQELRSICIRGACLQIHTGDQIRWCHDQAKLGVILVNRHCISHFADVLMRFFLHDVGDMRSRELSVGKQ